MAKQLTKQKRIADADFIRDATERILKAEVGETGQDWLEWKDLQALLQAAVGAEYKINPGILLGVLLVKDSPVKVSVSVRKRG